VLVPVDGSEQALFAVRHVADNMQESEAVLFTVLPLEREEGAASAPSSARRQQMEAEATAKLALAEEILRAAGVVFRTEVAFGDPAQQILDAAAAGPFDLIVMGRRGGGLSRALLGSVSDRVVKNAETPVTLVG
jgi:nucleotide-binding universal stress UspA family protein